MSIKAKSKITGETHTFSKAVWDRIPTTLHLGETYQKNGFVEVRFEAMSKESAEAIANAVKPKSKPGPKPKTTAK